ncbi:MAG: cbb3-type cytochrome c oxidase subunit I, partial [Pseudomonadota bacterium]
EYYELLFWSGGHLLQFLFTQLLMTVWFCLLMKFISRSQFIVKLGILTLWLNMILAIAGFLIHIFYDIESLEFYNLFTKHMQYCGGIAPIIAALIVIYICFNNFTEVIKTLPIAVRNCLFISLLLFLYGGFLGLLIHGSNVKIPAHYHGSIVGITIGLLGFCYFVILKMHLAKINGKLANIQPLIYGIGQILHITGLSLMGGYGALRKSVGDIGTIEGATEWAIFNFTAGKIMFFSGGALAIIGGLLFIIVVLRGLKL